MALFLSAIVLATLSLGVSAQFTLNLLNASLVAGGAVCLDGSPAGFMYHPGDPTKWIISMEGGGWCMSQADCAARAKTALGSSTSWAKTGKFGGVLDVVPAENPDFNTFSAVLIHYCDGASFSGDSQAGGLQYRGIRILHGVLDTLLDAHGLTGAKELLITGGSAGGLATILHADSIAARVKAAAPGVVVRAEADCGFFLNAVDIVSGTRLWEDQVKVIVALQNISTPLQVNAGCAAAHAAEPWRCFFANETYPHVTTPLFLTNSFHDTYQVGMFMEYFFSCVCGGTIVTLQFFSLSHASFTQMNHIECYACSGNSARKCLFTTPDKCPAALWDQFSAWGQLLVSTLNASVGANPQVGGRRASSWVGWMCAFAVL